MMVDFKWIQMALFLAAVLQFSAVSEQRELIIREGERVTLPCDNVLQDQHECEYTTWTFSRSGQAAKVLFEHGKIEHDKEHRLEMMKNCSLVIKKVTVKDVGLYTCQQHSDLKNPSQFPFSLSVVLMSTQEQSGNMELNCSVLTDGSCRFTVRWLFNGQKAVETPPSTCSAIFQKTSQTKESYECEVTDGGYKKLFPFSPQPSGDKPGKETTAKPATTKPTPVKPSSPDEASSEPAAASDCSALDYVMLWMRVAELVLITVITALLFRAQRNQEPAEDDAVLNPARRRRVMRSGPAASQVIEDDDDGVVNYENSVTPRININSSSSSF